jgi:hypothetical protein
MASRGDMCNDRPVARPRTGKTPLHNLRAAPEVWYPAHARTLIEDTDVTKVLVAALLEYGRTPPSRELSFAQWPEAPAWLEASYPAWRQCAAAIEEATAGLAGEEYIAVALWLAMSRNPGDRKQQQGDVAGFLVLRAATVTAGGWQERYLDSSALFRAISEVLESYLPPVAAPAGELQAADSTETGQ